jgi:hypothetical protein
MNTKILSKVEERFHYLLSFGVIVLPISCVITDYNDEKKQIWIDKIRAYSNANKNSMHMFTTENPMDQTDSKCLMHFCWILSKDFFQLPQEYFAPYVYNSFAIIYNENKQTQLKLHIDDSLITINMCLHNTSVGTNLIFQNESGNKSIYPNPEDYLVIHKGNLSHYVTKMQFGERINIVTWIKSYIE